METISSLIFSFFGAVKNGIIESAAFTGSAIGELMDKVKASFDFLLNEFPEVFEGFGE